MYSYFDANQQVGCIKSMSIVVLCSNSESLNQSHVLFHEKPIFLILQAYNSIF